MPILSELTDQYVVEEKPREEPEGVDPEEQLYEDRYAVKEGTADDEAKARVALADAEIAAYDAERAERKRLSVLTPEQIADRQKRGDERAKLNAHRCFVYGSRGPDFDPYEEDTGDGE